MTPRCILFLAQDPENAAPVKIQLQQYYPRCEVILPHSFQEFKQVLAAQPVDLVLADPCSPSSDALLCLHHVHAHYPHLPVILVNGSGVEAAAGVQVAQLGSTVEKALQTPEDSIGRPGFEQRLRQLQRMEAIATLAGGIVHDFNNILATMIGYAEMAYADIDPAGRPARDIIKVIQAGQRAKRLIKQILTFSRQHEQEIRSFAPAAALRETIKMLRATLPANIEIVQQIDPACGEIMADPAAMHQVIMNICTNAYHAMREQESGILTIRLYPVEITAENRPLGAALKPATYLCFEVRDSGNGIPGVFIDKIFTPYFTTRSRGAGTGLGLSVVHGIVKSYGGHVQVSSEPGQGATFQVFLPQIAKTVIQEVKLEAMAPPRAAAPAKIMLVDDDEQLLAVGKRQLERLGYEVNPFLGSEEALDIFRQNPDAYDLVITDMAMPKMTGKEFSLQLRTIRGDLPVVICTGFSNTLDEATVQQLGINAFLNKPFVISELAETVRDVLDGKNSRGRRRHRLYGNALRSA
ncbi:MAG: response regulator [Thermodesulfobacteriota bacterium]